MPIVLKDHLKNSLAEQERLRNLNKFESKFRSLGFRLIAGIDEAGRGPLAGPVVAAACIIDEGIFFEGVDDSKKLPPPKRKKLFEQITHHSQVKFGIGIIDAETIDRVNIYQATILAMHEALSELPVKPDYLLVDGMHISYAGIPCEKIIGGDGLSQSIAAASIIAKETRDALMVQFHSQYPNYHFDQHKGYATPLHKEALAKHGPCCIHRRSFAPCNSSLTSL